MIDACARRQNRSKPQPCTECGTPFDTTTNRGTCALCLLRQDVQTAAVMARATVAADPMPTFLKRSES